MRLLQARRVPNLWDGRPNSGVSMMRAKPFVLVAALLSLAAPAQAQAQNPAPIPAPTPAGLWQAVDDDTKQPNGWFLVGNHDGVYAGIIARMFLKPGEDPNVVCSQCKD